MNDTNRRAFLAWLGTVPGLAFLSAWMARPVEADGADSGDDEDLSFVEGVDHEIECDASILPTPGLWLAECTPDGSVIPKEHLALNGLALTRWVPVSKDPPLGELIQENSGLGWRWVSPILSVILESGERTAARRICLLKYYENVWQIWDGDGFAFRSEDEARIILWAEISAPPTIESSAQATVIDGHYRLEALRALGIEPHYYWIIGRKGASVATPWGTNYRTYIHPRAAELAMQSELTEAERPYCEPVRVMMILDQQINPEKSP